MIRSDRRNERGSALIAEFAPVLFVLLLIFTFPLINLLALATGYATIVVLTNETASQAASQANYSAALQAMAVQTDTVMGTGFANFAKLSPSGGFQGCGSNLYVQITNYHNGLSTAVGPNTPLNPPIDTSTNIYEYETKTTYIAQPFINMSRMPYIGNVPGLGKPFTLQYSVSKVAEHPDGLDNGMTENANANIDNSSVTTFNRTLVSTNPAGTDAGGVALQGTGGSGWNYPGIYQAIAAAGEVVVSENVTVVPATSYPFIDSACAAAAGQQVWFDYRADGIASIGSQWGGPYGPNGYGQNTSIVQNNNSIGSAFQFYNFPPGCLIGKMGGTSAQGSGGAPYMIGAGLYNYSPSQPGEIWLRYNDNTSNPSWFNDNTGQFIVRIIVTRTGP